MRDLQPGVLAGVDGGVEQTSESDSPAQRAPVVQTFCRRHEVRVQRVYVTGVGWVKGVQGGQAWLNVSLMVQQGGEGQSVGT